MAERLGHALEPGARRIVVEALEHAVGQRARLVQVPQRVVRVCDVHREHEPHIGADIGLAQRLAQRFERAPVPTRAVVRAREAIRRDRAFARGPRDRAHLPAGALHRGEVARAVLGLRAAIELAEGRAALGIDHPPAPDSAVAPHALGDIADLPVERDREARDEVELGIARVGQRTRTLPTERVVQLPDAPAAVRAREPRHAVKEPKVPKEPKVSKAKPKVPKVPKEPKVSKAKPKAPPKSSKVPKASPKAKQKVPVKTKKIIKGGGQKDFFE